LLRSDPFAGEAAVSPQAPSAAASSSAGKIFTGIYERQDVAMITIYGTNGCSITNRARAWLERQNIAYRFSDHGFAEIGRPLLEQ